MKYVILLICGLLMSCSSVNQTELANAEKFCDDKQGVYQLDVLWIGSQVYVDCRNGETKMINGETK